MLHSHPADAFTDSGTLARVPLTGGAPREMLENVLGADWSSDGTNLAVVRNVGGRNRIEYPIGKVLYEADGWVSHMRVSPKGDQIAFIDHPTPGDDGGVITVMDMSGKRTRARKTLGEHAGIGVGSRRKRHLLHGYGSWICALALCHRSFGA